MKSLLIQQLHCVYVELTGLALRFDMAREAQWWQWMAFGHKEDDLRMVVRYLQREIKNGKRNPGALKFSNLIGNPDFFEEDLQLARAAARHRGPARAHTVQTGCTERRIPSLGTEDASRPVSETALKILRDFREHLK